MTWPVVKLGEVAKHRKEFVTIEPDVNYARCRVQTSARGVILRDRVQGSEIKTKKQQVCRAGEFLVAEIDAKLGGYGLVPDYLAGAIVSSHYFLFTLDSSKLDKWFLDWFCRTSDFLQQVQARGSTNYAAIRPANVLEYRVPLPSLGEQRQIVARLDRVAMLAAEARLLKDEVDQDTASLTQSLHFHWSTERKLPFSNFVELWEDRQLVEPEGSYPQVGIKGFAGGLFTKTAVKGAETSYRAFNRLHRDLLVVSQPKGWEGAVAVCDNSVEGWFASPEYRTFKCRDGALLPRYLDMLIRTPWFQAELAQLTRGQGARRERLRPEMLLELEVTMPDVEAQQAALEVIDRCQVIRNQYGATTADLDALIPAMLHKVFGGAIPKPEPQASDTTNVVTLRAAAG